MKYKTIINNVEFDVEIDGDGHVFVNGEARNIDFLALSSSLYSIIKDNESHQVVIEGTNPDYSILLGGRLYEGQVYDQRALMMANRKGGLGEGSGDLKAPMPGLVVVVQVEKGQIVTQGETVIVLEAMKMQNELKSPIDGEIESLSVEVGQTVDKGDLLVQIKPIGE